jgi:hypothetical protein
MSVMAFLRENATHEMRMSATDQVNASLEGHPLSRSGDNEKSSAKNTNYQAPPPLAQAGPRDQLGL